MAGHRILDPDAEVRLLPPQIRVEDTGNRPQGNIEKGRYGEAENGRQGDGEIRRNGDREKRRAGDRSGNVERG